jgi:hypothetical protein
MYKIAQVQEPYSVIQYLVERIPLEQMFHLKLPEYVKQENSTEYKWTAWDICECIRCFIPMYYFYKYSNFLAFAIARGFVTPKAGRPDV